MAFYFAIKSLILLLLSLLRQHTPHEQLIALYKDELEKERRFQIVMANFDNEKLRSSYMASETSLFRYHNVTDVPQSIDWRKLGAVTPVKAQQTHCASCWAFSAVAAVEGIHQIRSGRLVSLSVQQLLDCDTRNNGCQPGSIDKAFEYIENYGLVAESDYPYLAKQGTCKTINSSPAVSITDYEWVLPPNDESALLKAVANQPVVVFIDGKAIRQYHGGISEGKGCNESNAKHTVTIVGYGIEGGKKYWLIKNSWGTSWGEGGYMKLAREVKEGGGLCGITTRALYPTI